MKTKKPTELNEDLASAVAGGLSSTPAHESHNKKDNEKAIIMKDLLQGLSFGPVAPECTDIRG